MDNNPALHTDMYIHLILYTTYPCILYMAVLITIKLAFYLHISIQIILIGANKSFSHQFCYLYQQSTWKEICTNFDLISSIFEQEYDFSVKRTLFLRLYLNISSFDYLWPECRHCLINTNPTHTMLP